MIDVTLTPDTLKLLIDIHPLVRQHAYTPVRSRPVMAPNSYLGRPRTPVRTPCRRQAYVHPPVGGCTQCVVRSR